MAASPEDDAATRHRLARSRREAQSNPLLAALADSRHEPDTAAARAAQAGNASRSLSERIADWFGRSRPEPASDAAVGGGHSGRDAYPWPPRADPPGDRRDDPAHDAYAAGDPARDEPSYPSEGDPPPPQAGDQTWRPLIDPLKVIGGVNRSKALIVATTLLGAVAGVAVALSTPKMYLTHAEVLVDPRDLKLVDRDLTTTGLSSEATLALVENQARVLTSGTVLNRVVERLNLASDPEFNSSAGGIGGLSGVVSMLRSLLSRSDGGGDGGRDHALAVKNLAENLSVERSNQTFVIEIGMRAQSPDKAALIANTMTDVFLETAGEMQSDTVGRAADELTARLDELRQSVEAAERRVETFKAENDIIDAQGRLITDDEIVRLNEQLAVARARTLELNARAASARDVRVEAVLEGALPEQLASTVMTELRSQYAALKQESDRLAVRLGPRHPQRLAVEAQLGGARDQMAAELRRVVSSVQVELKRAVQLEQELASRLAQLKVRQGDLSGEMVTLRELERDASSKRAVYEAFLLRARETAEQRGINSANISVISRASPPLDPLPPSRATISIAGMALGFMAGIALGAARGAVDSLRESAAGRRRRGTRRPTGAGTRRTFGLGVATRRETQGKGDAGPYRTDTDPSHETRPAAPEPTEEPTPVPYPAAHPGYAPTYAAPHPQHAAAMPQHGPPPMADHGYGPAGGYGAPAYPPMPPPAPPAWQAPAAYDAWGRPLPPQPPPHYPPHYPWQPQAYAPPPGPPAWHHGAYPPGYPPQAAPPHHAPPAPEPVRQTRAPEPAEPTPIDEIRASLREFRDAVRELTESRTKKSFF